MLKNNADQLRQRLLAARKAIPAARQQQQSQQICHRLQNWLAQHIGAARPTLNTNNLIVAAFWPLKQEPNLIPFLTYVHQLGLPSALPVVTQRDAPLEFHQWDPDIPMLSGSFGVQEPSSKVILRPNLILVPTLGFTRHGDRMGYGGGYYDRTLAALRTCAAPILTIGVSWQEGDLDLAQPGYQPNHHDAPLDAILTAEGWQGGLHDTPPSLYTLLRAEASPSIPIK